MREGHEPELEVLSNIPVNFDVKKVLKCLKLGAEASQQRKDTVKNLLSRANKLIAPKAVYTVGYVEDRYERFVDIGRVRFESKVLRKNLDKIEKVFPYIVTIGKKLEDEAASTEDLLEKYYLEEIADVALDQVRKYVEQYVQKKYKLGQLSRMSPGSLKDWPITEQKKLFSFFGDTKKNVGVGLTDNFLMVPRKSVSGIFFPTDIKFYSCQLCPRQECIRRKAPYDGELARSYQM